MKIPGYKHLGQGARWLQSWVQRGAIILGYHRVSEVGNDPFSLAVSPENFATQLSVLHRVATPIALTELVRRLREGERLPQHAVALTMDDGYADNLYKARPLLVKYDIPATIFVASGYLGREFWWDELVRFVFTSAAVDNALSLTTTEGIVEWQPRADRSPQKQRECLLRVLYRALRTMPEDERQKALATLRDLAPGDRTATIRHRALTRTELGALINCPLIEIGSHTHTHPVLADLPYRVQQAEIQQSKACLEALLERQITHFSYPNGSLSVETQALVREAGYMSACTSNNGAVSQQSDLFSLPRFWIPNWDGKRFSNWLRKWL